MTTVKLSLFNDASGFPQGTYIITDAARADALIARAHKLGLTTTVQVDFGQDEAALIDKLDGIEVAAL